MLKSDISRALSVLSSNEEVRILMPDGSATDIARIEIQHDVAPIYATIFLGDAPKPSETDKPALSLEMANAVQEQRIETLLKAAATSEARREAAEIVAVKEAERAAEAINAMRSQSEANDISRDKELEARVADAVAKATAKA